MAYQISISRVSVHEVFYLINIKGQSLQKKNNNIELMFLAVQIG